MILPGLFLSLFLALSPGEATVTVNGTIADSNKKPLSGARILFHPGSQSATSNESGAFSLKELKTGTYTVIVLRNGFTPLAKTIMLQSGKEITLDITLSANSKENFLAKVLKPSQKDLDSFHNGLKYFDEPDFCSESILQQGYESYRFLWQRTFHHPVLIQLTRKGPDNATLVYKELDGASGYEYGSLLEKKSVDVYKFLGRGDQPEDLVKSTVTLLFERAKKQAWDQPFAIVETFGQDGEISINLDGSYWTIEAAKDGKCHLVTRRSPEHGDPARLFGETLINISGKRFYYDEFY
jgi:hypothetical protein